MRKLLKISGARRYSMKDLDNLSDNQILSDMRGGFRINKERTMSFRE